MSMNDELCRQAYQNFTELEVHEQVRRLGMYLEAKTCPDHLRPQLTVLDDLLAHASQCEDASEKLCPYPNCKRGKVLFRHVFLCLDRRCRLCTSMLHLVKFHAGACTASNCNVPRCREIKEHNLCKEQRLKRKEQRLRNLQQSESQRAAAAAAEWAMQVAAAKKAVEGASKLEEGKQQPISQDATMTENVNPGTSEAEKTHDLTDDVNALLQQALAMSMDDSSSTVAVRDTGMLDASADDHNLQLAIQLSVQDGQGDQSNQKNMNKLLGNQSVVSSIHVSQSWFQQKKEEDEGQKEEEKK